MFSLAKSTIPRAKILLWGDSGCGKTIFALRWSRIGGKIAVIDLEGSTRRYDTEFEFYRAPTPQSMQDFKAQIRWLATNKHEYTTLLIDPITIVWELHQRYWEEKFLQTRVGKKGHNGDHYEVQPRDWGLITPSWRDVFRELNNLDMNIICTARMKPLYSDSGEMMKKVGDTFDAQKGTHYEMDTVFKMTHVQETGQYIIHVNKHRSFNKPMPSPIDITGGEMKFFVDYFGDSITRRAVPIQKVDEGTRLKIDNAVAFLGFTDDQKRKSLAKFGATNTDDLHQDNAETILAALEKQMAAKSPF